MGRQEVDSPCGLQLVLGHLGSSLCPRLGQEALQRAGVCHTSHTLPGAVRWTHPEPLPGWGHLSLARPVHLHEASTNDLVSESNL